MPYADPEVRKAYARAYYKAQYIANTDAILARNKVWMDANKERVIATNRAWRVANPEKSRATCARHRAQKLNATPPWQSREELDEIWAGCPEGHHVDHIHPLKGKLSCGLNVPWNLQYLPASLNSSKGNKMPQPGYLDWFGHDKEHSVWPRSSQA